MTFIIGFTLRWLLKSWLLAKLAIVVRRWLVKKYNLEANFKQTKSDKKIKWSDIRWYVSRKNQYRLQKRL